MLSIEPEELTCTAVQNLTEQHPSISDAIRENPSLVQELMTHGLTLERMPEADVHGTLVGLRAIGLTLRSLVGATINGGRLCGVNLTGCDATGSTFVDVVFAGCYLHGANFHGARFLRCAFTFCEISKNDFRSSRFEDCSLKNCDAYANWAFGCNIPQAGFGADAFGFDADCPPWEQGLCDWHAPGGSE